MPCVIKTRKAFFYTRNWVDLIDFTNSLEGRSNKLNLLQIYLQLPIPAIPVLFGFAIMQSQIGFIPYICILKI
jgi:hypothetical protein